MAGVQFIHHGEAVDYTPGADVAAGDVVVQGDLIGVAKRDIKTGVLGALAVVGVFDFPKEAGGGVTFSYGDLAYWDDTNDVAVATDGAGTNKLIGKAVADAADNDAEVRIRLQQ